MLHLAFVGQPILAAAAFQAASFASRRLSFRPKGRRRPANALQISAILEKAA
jgi:hypothetical protein